ncbi:hypothetical protein GCM10023198_05790 [Promicromonospora umidemergens]|uniref:Uncharacterized protein n=1 Tax=Promicromonospora umidemergens TaxID=629679 RepID=A0ABP8WKJ0_9MICO
MRDVAAASATGRAAPPAAPVSEVVAQAAIVATVSAAAITVVVSLRGIPVLADRWIVFNVVPSSS